MIRNRLLTRAAFIVVAVICIAAICIGGYYYSLRDTPAYSLALIVDASKRDDAAELEQLVDLDAVVDDFVPQVTAKAVDLYGRGLPVDTIGRIAGAAAPLFPVVKQRARVVLPRVVRDRTREFPNVPFFVLVISAGRFLDITINDDTAVIRSKIPERPLDLKMHLKEGKWRVSGIKDEALAAELAQRIGQQIIALAAGKITKETIGQLGIDGLADTLKDVQEQIK